MCPNIVVIRQKCPDSLAAGLVQQLLQYVNVREAYSCVNLLWFMESASSVHLWRGEAGGFSHLSFVFVFVCVFVCLVL